MQKSAGAAVYNVFIIILRLFKKCEMRGRRFFLRRARIKTYVTEAKNESDKADCTF